jgi:hypothetical protein
MNSQQAQWFAEGAGCGGGSCYLTADAMLLTVQSIGAVAIFIYVAWLCVSAYNDFGQEQISATDMVIVWSRGVFVLMVILYLLIN